MTAEAHKGGYATRASKRPQTSPVKRPKKDALASGLSEVKEASRCSDRIKERKRRTLEALCFHEAWNIHK